MADDASPTLDEEKRLPSASARIIGGSNANLTQFPFFALIYFSGNPQCGGSLISTQWVLTAARGLSGTQLSQLNNYAIYLGNLASQSPFSTGSVKALPTAIFIHELYTAVNYQNNIALMQIPTVTLTANIQPVTLAIDATNNFNGQVAFLMGFGRTADTG
ncbi:uncharacterized protein LOC132195796 [Neocloeon triangulifer]|uniref:uncharacterized protein LOC132195796 n=1 Tax=Neocloeon triangulifer TaxID=2078957 RepID=UPI00286F4B04|nr:uncharacterized protein LOC132195796 [Neocloeon triangulifer]